MSKPIKNLKLGSAMIDVAGRGTGQVRDLVFNFNQDKIEHTTNVFLQYRKDTVLGIMSSCGVSCMFEHFNPFNLNVVNGMQGYSAVPVDRSLGGSRMPMGLYAHYALRESEIRQMSDLQGQPEWQHLTYPMFNADTASPPVPLTVTARNAVAPQGDPTGYVGFMVSALNSPGVNNNESIPTQVVIVPYENTTDGVNIRVYFTPGSATAIRVYRFAYTFDAATQTYQGTWVTSARLQFAGPQDWRALSGGEQAQGYADFSTTIDGTLVAGVPVNPVTVTSLDGLTTYDWLEDYEVNPLDKTGSAIRRVPGGAIEAFDIVSAAYWKDGARIAEMPVGTPGPANPVVPIKFASPFPYGDSQIVVRLWACQVQNSFSLAFTDRDWSGLQFNAEALTRENIYPNYPFGVIEISGEIVDEIRAGGNVPFQLGNNQFPLESYQTDYS